MPSNWLASPITEPPDPPDLPDPPEPPPPPLIAAAASDIIEPGCCNREASDEWSRCTAWESKTR